MFGVKSSNNPISGEFAVKFCEELQRAIAIRKNRTAGMNTHHTLVVE